MCLTLSQLEIRLLAFASQLPSLRVQHPDPEECLQACRVITDEIQAAAEYDEHVAHEVHVQINHLFVDAGLIPAEHRQF